MSQHGTPLEHHSTPSLHLVSLRFHPVDDSRCGVHVTNLAPPGSECNPNGRESDEDDDDASRRRRTTRNSQGRR
jgi:hypothetical protein